jgi:hypothetical protein
MKAMDAKCCDSQVKQGGSWRSTKSAVRVQPSSVNSFAADLVEAEAPKWLSYPETFACSPQLKTEIAKKRRAHLKASGRLGLCLLNIIFASNKTRLFEV